MITVTMLLLIVALVLSAIDAVQSRSLTSVAVVLICIAMLLR